MKTKAGFSPWHTKENSFEEDQVCLTQQASLSNRKDKTDKKSESKLSSRKKTQQQNETHSVLRSFSKTQNFLTPFEEISTLSFKRKVTRSSQKIDCQHREDTSGKKFDDQKWKILTITSNDRFKSECAQFRKYQHMASELKSRRSSLRTNPTTPQPTQKQKQKPALQQVSIRNFIIHGHYTDKESLYQMSKRRDASYVMKQKFASLKKTIDCKQNNDPCGRKVVVVRGNTKEKEGENLFKVIKIEREINLKNNRVL